MDKVPEVTPDRSEKFLITFDEDDYENQSGADDEEEVNIDDTVSKKSSCSNVPLSINDSPPVGNNSETPPIYKLTKLILTGLVNQQENRIQVNSSSIHLLDKENKEDLKEEFLFFQWKDGVNPVTEIDLVSRKLYRNTIPGQVSSLEQVY